MYLTNPSLSKSRNIPQLEPDLAPHMTPQQADNAEDKTNSLESVFHLAARSPARPRSAAAILLAGREPFVPGPHWPAASFHSPSSTGSRCTRFHKPLRSLRDLLIGPPIPSIALAYERLSNIRALAAMSPDALSSIAYANQEIFLGLVVAGAAGLAFSWYIALAIAALLAVLALSYSQTIRAYPSGGGSYTVARENLGVNFGLVAAAALMTDYVLNVAVSVTAGVAAAASAFPMLWPYRTILSLGLLAVVTLANLRGLRESGAIMTVPVYFFLAMYLSMIAAGIFRAVAQGPGSFTATAPPASLPVTLFLVLHTFSAGCTALTGVESISNGVPVFKPPESKHANQTMAAMAILMGILFMGTTGLTQYLAVVAGSEETILSALAHSIWGSGALYFLVQASTLLVLMVAANTSFVGFPRVASIVARDGYLPRQLTFLGDRLVYSNGIILLAGLAGVLVLIFEGDTHGLIPLFAVGAFLAFTLSQAGNGLSLGAETRRQLASQSGAQRIWHERHRRGGGRHRPEQIPGRRLDCRSADPIGGVRLSADTSTLRGSGRRVNPARPAALPKTAAASTYRPAHLQPSPGRDRGGAIRPRISDRVTAVYVEIEPGSGEKLRAKWEEWGLDDDARLEIVPSPYRSVVGPFLEFLERTDRECNDGQEATVLLSEFVEAHWWQALLHNQTAWLIKLALLYRRRTFDKTRAIIDVPFYLRK